jgi:hypothetical protein
MRSGHTRSHELTILGGESMSGFTRHRKAAAVAAAAAIMFLPAGSVFAHCDTMDGPIVPEAQTALETGDITPVLKWVPRADEPAVQQAFRRALAVRDRGGDVREVADQYFLETLIRIHRQGEGAPFTGLKPAGTMAPAFVAADEALGSGDAADLVAALGQALEEEMHRRFAVTIERRAHADDSVEAGREYVEAYVAYIHFVEELHSLLEHGPTSHGLKPAAGKRH